MQTRFGVSILFFITAFIALSSCSKKTNREGRYIPKTAGIVILINSESVSSKLPWEEIKQNDLFKSLNTDTSLGSYIKATMQNPENTGIDMKKNLMIFLEKDSLGAYMAFEGSVMDAAKFKAYNAAMAKEAVESEKDGIHFLHTAKVTSSYDKEKFVVIIDVPEINMANGLGRTPGNSSFIPAPASKRDALNAATRIYNLPEDNSLGTDEKFSDLVHTKADLLFWFNAHALMSDNAGMAALNLLNIGKLYEDSYVTAAASFDNGKINVEVKSYSGKELTDIYQKYSGSSLNTDMIKRIPAKDVAFLFGLSFKPEGLKELLKMTGMDGFANMGAAKIGITLDDFIKANKGDILLSVSDLTKDSMGKLNANGLFAATVGDRNSFGKLIEAGNKLAGEMTSGNADKFLSYKADDKFFALGTDKASVDKFVSSSNNSNFNFLDKLSGSPSVFYLNIPVLLSALGNEAARDSLDNIAFETTIKTWENVIATGGGFKDGAATMHVEFNLMDKNTNSLKQLNKYMGTIGNIQEQKKLIKDNWMNSEMNMPDTTTTVTIPAQ